MTRNATPLTAEEIDEAQLYHDRFCNVCKPESRICAVARLLATIDQQAKQLECGDCDNPKGFAILCADCWSHYYRSDVTSATPSDETLIAAFGSAVLRRILADTSFFESEESEQWCELLEHHGYVERGVWDSAKHGESSVLGDGDEAWIFTEKMRRDAEPNVSATSIRSVALDSVHAALDEAIRRVRRRGNGFEYENKLIILGCLYDAIIAAARSEKA